MISILSRPSIMVEFSSQNLNKSYDEIAAVMHEVRQLVE